MADLTVLCFGHPWPTGPPDAFPSLPDCERETRPMIGVEELPDWRDARAYDYTAQLSRREWAWEFLRRNSDFQRDLTVALENVEYRERCTSFIIGKSSVDLTKWELMFRKFIAAGCNCLLVSRTVPANIASNR